MIGRTGQRCVCRRCRLMGYHVVPSNGGAKQSVRPASKDVSRNCHTWTDCLPFRMGFHRNLRYRQRWAKTSNRYQENIDFVCQIYDEKLPSCQTYALAAGHLDESLWRKGKKNFQIFLPTFKSSKDVGPGSSGFLPTVVEESLVCAVDPECPAEIA